MLIVLVAVPPITGTAGPTFGSAKLLPLILGNLPVATEIAPEILDVFFQPVVNAVPTLYFILPTAGGTLI